LNREDCEATQFAFPDDSDMTLGDGGMISTMLGEFNFANGQ
jgi:hypothetical protein